MEICKWKLIERKKKNVKRTKQAYVFKSYASSNNVEILNSSNPEMQLKDNESAIKSKLKKLLSGIKRILIRDNISFSA